MKVLHVLDVSWPILRGYSMRAYYITKYQNAGGIEPIVLTSGRQYEENVAGLHEGVKYFRTPRVKKWVLHVPFIPEALEVIGLRRRIVEVAKAEGVDIIHAHSPSLWGLAAVLAGRKLKKRVIYEIRALWEDAAVDAGKMREGGLFYEISRRLETLVAKKCSKVVAICNGIRNDLIERGVPEQRIVVVPNGIDTERFRPMKKNRDLLEKYALNQATVFGFVGSMFNFEGLEVLIESVSKLEPSTKQKIRVVLVGEGEKFEEISRMVKERRLEEHVFVTGKVPHDEIKEYYSIIDVLVYPRIRRRITQLVTPLKPLEAMAMGKAVIVSDVGGLVELLPSDNCGLAFKAEDAGDLAGKIEYLVSHPDRVVELGDCARREVTATKGWDKMVKIYVDKAYTS